jgi:hypothetical protein
MNSQIRHAVVRSLRVVLPVVLVTLVAGVAAACPTCRDGVAQNDPQGRSLAAGFYYSILFMMSVPYAILMTFGCLAWRSIRKARAEETLEGGVE